MEQKRRIIPPLWLLLALLSMAALHYFLPIARIVSPPWSFLGILLIVIGVGIAAHAARAFDQVGTPVIPFEPSTALVTGGLYLITRNPMYLGMVIALLGAALLFGTLTAFLPIPIFVWIIQKGFIEGEERFLEEIFGAQYLAYKKRVRRWL